MKILRGSLGIAPKISFLLPSDLPTGTKNISINLQCLEEPSLNTLVSTTTTKLAGNQYEITLQDLDYSYILNVSISNVANSQAYAWTFQESYEVIRPYGTFTSGTASENDAWHKNESLARAIIDSVVIGGFYSKIKTVEETGNGTDYLSIWDRFYDIDSVTENGLDITEAIVFSPNKSALMKTYTEYPQRNRSESAPLIIPGGSGDLSPYGFNYVDFPAGANYFITGKFGYQYIPSDIKQAADLLVHDISCGKLDYYTRYVTTYNTDQYRIQFDPKMFSGTGNIIVDRILQNYANDKIAKPGVL